MQQISIIRCTAAWIIFSMTQYFEKKNGMSKRVNMLTLFSHHPEIYKPKLVYLFCKRFPDFIVFYGNANGIPPRKSSYFPGFPQESPYREFYLSFPQWVVKYSPASWGQSSVRRTWTSGSPVKSTRKWCRPSWQPELSRYISSIFKQVHLKRWFTC